MVATAAEAGHALQMDLPHVRRAVYAAAESAKCSLSQAVSISIRLPESVAPDWSGAHLTREQLEALCAPLLTRCAAPLLDLLARAEDSDGNTVPPAALSQARCCCLF